MQHTSSATQLFWCRLVAGATRSQQVYAQGLKLQRGRSARRRTSWSQTLHLCRRSASLHASLIAGSASSAASARSNVPPWLALQHEQPRKAPQKGRLAAEKGCGRG
jgi:hypothetical protein